MRLSVPVHVAPVPVYVAQVAQKPVPATIRHWLQLLQPLIQADFFSRAVRPVPGTVWAWSRDPVFNGNAWCLDLQKEN